MIETYTTSRVARLTGVHPNTVRLYETLDLITAPARKANGYRIFTPLHIAQMRLAQAALRVPVMQAGLRKLAISIIRAAAACDIQHALALTAQYETKLASERRNAVEAASIAHDVLMAKPPPEADAPMRRSEAAKALALSIDQLRGWEMNGLLTVRRRRNGYRIYSGDDMRRLRMIRALRCANYSLSSILRLLRTLQGDPAANAGQVLDTPAADEEIVSVCDRLVTSLDEAAACAKEIRLRIDEIQNFMAAANPPL